MRYINTSKTSLISKTEWHGHGKFLSSETDLKFKKMERIWSRISSKHDSKTTIVSRTNYDSDEHIKLNTFTCFFPTLQYPNISLKQEIT